MIGDLYLLNPIESIFYYLIIFFDSICWNFSDPGPFWAIHTNLTVTRPTSSPSCCSLRINCRGCHQTTILPQSGRSESTNSWHLFYICIIWYPVTKKKASLTQAGHFHTWWTWSSEGIPQLSQGSLQLHLSCLLTTYLPDPCSPAHISLVACLNAGPLACWSQPLACPLDVNKDVITP